MADGVGIDGQQAPRPRASVAASQNGAAPDDETQPLDPRANFVKDAATEIRMGFIRKVYGILSVQLLLTVAIAGPIQTADLEVLQQHSWILPVSWLMLLVTICSLSCCPQTFRKFPNNYICLVIITVFMSIVVGFTSAQYTWQSVILAAGITVLIFLAMTVYAFTTSTDFTGFGPYLFAGLMVLMMFGFTIMILSLLGVPVNMLIMAYDAIGVLLFTFYIVYDTQLIIGEYGGHRQQFSIDDYCFAALNLYLDLINLFLHLLSLLGNRR